MTPYSTVQSDSDPLETQEWIDSLESVLEFSGPNRARFVLARLLARARAGGFVPDHLLSSDYVNTIPARFEADFPGDEALEERISDIIRWNAAVMVTRANIHHNGLGGHISTFASSAELLDVGFNHFFQGKRRLPLRRPDLLPGPRVARHLRARVPRGPHHRSPDGQLPARGRARQEGLSSYPHPRLMPEFWEFPTVSMGLGPIASIYQARFNRYLQARGITDTSESRVWCFVGDGETDEPETLGALSVAAREGLDNLTWVVNCNLQRLDGPVRGNGKIVQELETVFRGAGWNVLKVLWGSEWDDVFERDKQALLRQRMNEVVDGELQKYRSADGAYIRQHFFGTSPELLEVVSHLSDDEIWAMRRGGHDMRKVYTAYKAAVEHRGRPDGDPRADGQGLHARRRLRVEERHAPDQEDVARPTCTASATGSSCRSATRSWRTRPTTTPARTATRSQYLLERRKALGGSVPTRNATFTVDFDPPNADLYEEFYAGTKNPGGVSTTMAFVRLLDEADQGQEHRQPHRADHPGRGAHVRHGAALPPDRHLRLEGSALRAGRPQASCSTTARARTARCSRRASPRPARWRASWRRARPTRRTASRCCPFYIFYSMFGFQRIGDLVWAFADARGRGFLMGATAGRTTLNGEGLQHEDGHSHVLATTFPNVRRLRPGLRLRDRADHQGRHAAHGRAERGRLLLHHRPERELPAAADAGGRRGGRAERALPLQAAPSTTHELRVQLFGSGVILNEALRAQEILGEQFGVAADVWSRDELPAAATRGAASSSAGTACIPRRSSARRTSQQVLADVEGPFIAVDRLHEARARPDRDAGSPGRFVARARTASA